MAIEAAFSGVQSQDALNMLQGKLASQISPDRLKENVNAIASEALEGAMAIRSTIEREYGRVRILGKGESGNPIMPSKIQPDLVAFAEGAQKAILIESKGTAHKSSGRDIFQASSYNGIATKFGVLLIHERIENDKRTIAPVVKFDQPAETLLIYPRRQEYERIQDSITVDEDLARKIWAAKQRGMMGKLPETRCGSDCPHHRFKEKAKVDTIEPAKPLPMIFARGYDEAGYDMDAQYEKRLAFRFLALEIRLAILLGRLPGSART